ncbi:cytochrome c oxidase subunit I [Thermoactinomyces sp. DSM 45892]|uniref:cytochrome c oxidase subunit I n=1 Tax=Thermoactinomyces sp. DSM 45892 TaxID=1882753 RepID=UPI000B8749C9|nr:cytochrome c oxidase subunit I [Thermoactinomyces sp. DSM 45892]
MIVFGLFFAAIFTGGYNNTLIQRARKTVAWDWLTSVDHKKIGVMYFMAGIFYFVVGGLEALFMRYQLLVPGNDAFVGRTFNELLTMHGTTMIFFAAMPLIFGLINVVMPLQIGARDVAFPFLNSLGFWLFFFGALLTNMGWIFGGAPDAGWTSYVQLALNEYSPGPGVDYYVLGLQIAGAGTTISGINFLVTILNMRTKGMSFLRMPMFTWTSLITSVLIIFAMPPLTIALLLLMMDRLFGANFFDHVMGGSAVLWEHLFWIFGHPEVYIVVLPAFGIMSEIFSTFSKKKLFGYNSMVFATSLIGFLGFMVWVHHMFTVGLGPVSNSIFAVATMLIAIPTGIKVFNWLFTMWGGELTFPVAMKWAIGFIPTFVIGGMTGIMLAAPPADFQYQDSYFVVAHFHYVLIGGTVFALLAGAYYWWPKMFGKMLSERLGNWHFWTFFIGFHLTFFPQHFLGLFGMPRRVFTYEPNVGLEYINQVSTLGAVLMGIGTIIFAWNMIQSFRSKKIAAADPWDGRSLEWATQTPVPFYNFAQLPEVRGVDAFWLEKQAGNKKMTPAEPLGKIHMPSGSHIPFLMSLALFVGGWGLIARSWEIGVMGLLAFAVTMFMRSFDRDHGFYVKPKELLDKEAKS